MRHVHAHDVVFAIACYDGLEIPFPFMNRRLLPGIALVTSAVVISVALGVGNGMFLPMAAQLNGGDGPPSGSELPSCGNGACDAGEMIPPYGGSICFQDCRCGDGRCDAHETSGSGMYCPADCGDECGDGNFGITEECEDGNKLNGDGCNMDCKNECGDGVQDKDASDGYEEECDGGAGCESECKKSPELPANPPVTGSGSTYCKPFEPGFNDINADRVNVVFVGAGISGTGELVNAIEISSKHIASFEPFASAKDKLQYWYAPDIKPLGEGKDDYTKSCVESCASDISCPELGKQYVNILCDRECLSHADFDGVTHISYPDLKDNPGTFAHEFGHQFGELPDEYIYKEAASDWTKYPSCAPSLEKAREWWGKLAGKTDNLGPVGYYEGCAYGDTNYRPDRGPGNVMWVGSRWYGYGELIHQPYIKRKLDTYSGNPPRQTEPGDEPERKDTAWTYAGFALPETALRMTFERQDDGTYAIRDSDVVEVPYGVKPTMQSGMAVSVKVGGKDYTQTFSDSRVSIGEDFSDPEEIKLGSFTQTPIQTITVDVGLGDTPPTIAADELNPVITACNDNDESGENDCPAPMFLGAEVVTPTPVESPSSSSRSTSSVRSSVASSSPRTSFSSASTVSSSLRSSALSSIVADVSSSSGSSQAAIAVHAAASDTGMGWVTIIIMIVIGLSIGACVGYMWSGKRGE